MPAVYGRRRRVLTGGWNPVRPALRRGAGHAFAAPVCWNGPESGDSLLISRAKGVTDAVPPGAAVAGNNLLLLLLKYHAHVMQAGNE